VTEQDRAEVEALVDEWVYVPDIVERFGMSLAQVRRFIADRDVLTLRVGPRKAVGIPARFLGADGPRPDLKGTFTVLSDGGMNDLEIIRWIFTVDPSMPGGGSPLDALAAGHKTEVRRRAQALAF
jgi:hypothetical protein